MIHDYNQNMGGVDRNDQMILYYGYSHRFAIKLCYRSKKWWKRIFFHILDLAVVNANILYNETAQKPLKHLEFRLELIKSLLEGHVPRIDR